MESYNTNNNNNNQLKNALSFLSSQYKLIGNSINLHSDINNVDDVSADIIRDALASRSNALLSATQLTTQTATELQSSTSMQTFDYSERAAKMYTDWDESSDSSSKIKYRSGKPYVFHKSVGKWVPTLEVFDYAADIQDWLNMHITASEIHRTATHNDWCSMSRSFRINLPYSYNNIVVDINKFSPCSIIIKNIGNNVIDADVCMAFSAFGPIIDYYRPVNYLNKKKSFFVFIEFYMQESVDNIISFMGDLQFYYNNKPIIVERAGSRKTAESLKN